ncbi:MAG: sulfatase, partial [Treponema sp.]|nr:sulfatase [Treponema sp.]
MMNIVYMHTHDSGRFLEPYGYGISTPRLMALAEESTLFRHCYCAGPTCSPSRAALLTGTWPHVNGMTGLAHRGFALRDYSMHLANYLAGAGYETALCGIQHEADRAEKIGYHKILQEKRGTDMYINDPDGYDLNSAEKAAAYLEDQARTGRDFFLSFGMINTHRDFPNPEGRVNQAYVQPPFTLFDNKMNRLDMAGYIASAATADRSAGMVIDALRRTGLDNNTILIFTTDHGIAFPWMKCNLYDPGIGVALMIKYPGNPTLGTASDALVSQIDLFPTLCDLLELPRPSWLSGVSLRPILEGKAEKVNKQIFSEVTYHAAYEPKRCVRTDRYKLIRHYDFHNKLPPSNIDNGLSKRFMMEAGIFSRTVPREQLFDLWLDPVERENMVDNPAYETVYRDLSQRLLNWMEDTADPLLQYPYRVPYPHGAKVNTFECIHAE